MRFGAENHGLNSVIKWPQIINFTSLNIYLLISQSKNESHNNAGKWDNIHLILHLCELITRNKKCLISYPFLTKQVSFLFFLLTLLSCPCFLKTKWDQSFISQQTSFITAIFQWINKIVIKHMLCKKQSSMSCGKYKEI